MYNHIHGDLFASDTDAIGHGCNCVGAMGAGIAKEFRRRWPEMYWYYNDDCKTGKFRLGRVMAWQDPKSKLWIYNMATQKLMGAHANLQAIEVAAKNMLAHAQKHDVQTIALPRIGSGIGGLEWSEVDSVLRSIFEDSPVSVTIYSL